MRTFLTSLLLLLSIGEVSAADLGPGSRLMLAAIVAEHSPLLGEFEKRTIARLAAGNLPSAAHKNKVIAVAADDLECRVSNVDITSRFCDIRFGRQTVTLKGRGAHELFATIAEMGVAPTGAAGSFFIGVSRLNCALNPNELRQKAGSGAECSFGPATE